MKNVYNVDDDEFFLFDEIDFWNDYWKVEREKNKNDLQLKKLKYKKNILKRLSELLKNKKRRTKSLIK